MAPALEDGIPAHLRRSIDATLKGKRDIFKPPPCKQPAVVPIPLSPSDLVLQAVIFSGSSASSTYSDGNLRDGMRPFGGVASDAWHSLSCGGGGANASALHRSRSPPTLNEMLHAAPSGPAILGAARAVGGAWARQQHREWYRGQLAKRQERVNAEAERLFLTAIGPLGIDQHVWAKLPGKVEAVALRNVQRQEAVELQRLRLEEWSPPVVSRSAQAAVQSALAELRGPGSTASLRLAQGRAQDLGQGLGQGGVLETASEQEVLRCQGSEAGLAAAAGSHRSSGSGSSAAAAGGGGGGGGGGAPQRRCMSALPHRYMETDRDRHRIRKALDKLAAKHADSLGDGAATATASSPFKRLSPRPPTAAADGTPGGGGGEGGEGRGPSLAPSPMALLQSLRARREARWPREAVALASRVSQFMEAESPASPRVALAAETYRAELRAKATAYHSHRSHPPAAAAAATSGLGSSYPGLASPNQCRSRGGSPRGANNTRSTQGCGGGRSARLGSSRRSLDASSAVQVQVAEEAEAEELEDDKEAQATQLVELYEAACRRLRLHVEPGISASLRRSFASLPGVKGHCLHLVALTLTSGVAAQALAEVLPRCTHINAVTLERCAVSVEALAVVLPALWVLPLRRITTLNTDFPPASWVWLQRALGRPTVWGYKAGWWLSLRQLSLTGNGLADQGLSALVEVLVAMPQLQVLALRQCGMSDLSAPQLERLLGECTSLRELDVGYNNLGDKAVGALARGLPKANQLLRLSLPWNSLGGGVAQLCWTVLRLGPRHCRLTHLDLAGTDLVAQDLFALAAILRAWPHTPVRHLNLSHNNLIGVAGQCLLRHANLLMQSAPEQAAAATSASATADADSPAPIPSSISASHIPAGVASSRALAASDVVGGGGGGNRPLVPILKMPGSTAPAAPGVSRADSPVKRLTINPNPQSAAPPPPPPSSQAPSTPKSEGLISALTSAAFRPLQQHLQQQLPGGPSSPYGGGLQAAAPAPAAAAAAAAAAGEVGSRRQRPQPPEPQPFEVVTTGCVVVPTLPPGARLLVRPDGRPVDPVGEGDLEDRGLEDGSEAAQLRQRERERERERQRERERERRRWVEEMQQQSQVQSQQQGSAEGSSGGTAAAGPVLTPSAPTSTPIQTPAPGADAPLRVECGLVGAGGQNTDKAPGGYGSQLANAAAAATIAAAGTGTGMAVLEPSGPHAFHRITLDLVRDLPDRTTAALLLEHEVEARRHGYRSAFYGVKWRGKVHKRDGVEIDPLDPVYLGWTHSLPRVGLLELVVRVLPPQLCPWLGNPCLHCNTESS